MKKLLITTSAIVAVTAFAGVAQAADPIKLSVGGKGNFFVGHASNDGTYKDAQVGAVGDGRASEEVGIDVQQDAEIYFSGSTVLDNGLTIAFRYDLEAKGAGENADELFAEVRGSFGTINVGLDDPATNKIALGHKDMSGSIAFDAGEVLSGRWVAQPANLNISTATNIGGGADFDQISYISPSMGGFTFGATYIPEMGAATAEQALETTTGTGETYGVGALWQGDFSGVSIGVEAGYAWMDPNAQTVGGLAIDELTSWQFGSQIGYAGFTLGGAYLKNNSDLVTTAANQASDNDNSAWQVGLAYETGPYGVSLGYFNSTGTDGFNMSDDEVTMWQLGAQYTMGPGVVLSGALAQVDFEEGEVAGTNTPGLDNDGMVIITGLNLAF